MTIYNPYRKCEDTVRIKTESEILSKLEQRIQKYYKLRANSFKIGNSFGVAAYGELIKELETLFKWIKGEEYY